MAIAAGMQGASALSYLGLGTPGLTPGKLAKTTSLTVGRQSRVL